MEKKLSEFTAGQEGEVKVVGGEGRVRRRLFDMGLTPSARIVMRKVAPLGDPIQIALRGYELTLRKSEAECVIVEVKETDEVARARRRFGIRRFKKSKGEKK